jgi:hypothetical protein
MTNQYVPIDTLPPEQALHWLQQHLTTWTGYAFALAQQADLTPEEAAHFFMQPLLTPGQVHLQADEQALERQAKQSAATMILMHGDNNVHLERDGDQWLLRATLTDLKGDLEPWGISLEFFTRWLGEQARLVGLPKGIVYTTWLEEDTLFMRLNCQPE